MDGQSNYDIFSEFLRRKSGVTDSTVGSREVEVPETTSLPTTSGPDGEEGTTTVAGTEPQPVGDYEDGMDVVTMVFSDPNLSITGWSMVVVVGLALLITWCRLRRLRKRYQKFKPACLPMTSSTSTSSSPTPTDVVTSEPGPVVANNRDRESYFLTPILGASSESTLTRPNGFRRLPTLPRHERNPSLLGDVLNEIRVDAEVHSG